MRFIFKQISRPLPQREIVLCEVLSEFSIFATCFAVRVINVWNAPPADRVDFLLLLHLNGLYSRLIYQCFFIMLLGLGYVHFWVIISVTSGLTI